MDKALNLLKEDLIQRGSVRPSLKELKKRYGSRAEGMYQQIALDEAKKFLHTYTAEYVLCLKNAFDFYDILEDRDSLFERNTPQGKNFSFANDPIKLRFEGESIFCLEGNEIIFQCDNVEELQEKVSLDMRTKKFKNVLKRRAGEEYSNEIEKVDMRKKDFKDAIKRKKESVDGISADLKNELDKKKKNDNPVSRILRKFNK